MTGVSARVHFGRHAEAEEADAERLARLRRTWARWAFTSRQVSWMVSSGAPESSNWPPGSSEMAAAPEVGQADDVLLLGDRMPAERLHGFQERADAAPAVIGHRAYPSG